MAEPFLGEIRMLGFGWAPKNYALCDGATIAISANPPLFALLDTAFGGDGRTTFNLPDMRGRAPVHQGNGYQRGYAGGVETVTLSPVTLPQHTHTFNATNTTDSQSFVADGVSTLAEANGDPQTGTPPIAVYAPASNLVEMAAGTSGFTGDGASHNNQQPSISVNFVICLTGQFPSRN